MAYLSEIFKEQNVPYRCTVKELKQGVRTKKGNVMCVANVDYASQPYSWWLDPKQFTDLFSGITIGDEIEITQFFVSGQKFPQHTVKKVSVPSSDMAAGEARPGRRQEIIQNRISIAGYLQALINSGKHDIEACKTLALELVEWSTKKAEEMYDSKQAEDDMPY